MSFATNSVKVVLLGDSGVGKSSIAIRFAQQQYEESSTVSTIGAAYLKRSMNILIETEDDDDDDEWELDNPASTSHSSSNGSGLMLEDFPAKEYSRVEFQIWDTAGQERYASLAPMYYRGAGAAILVYDITDRISYDRLKEWVQELETKGPKDLVIAICGNKLDSSAHREVTSEEASEYAYSVQAALYVEASAQNDLNIEEMFKRVGNLVLTQRKMLIDDSEEMRRAENGGSLDAIDRSFRLEGMNRSKYNNRRGCCVAKL